MNQSFDGMTPDQQVWNLHQRIMDLETLLADQLAAASPPATLTDKVATNLREAAARLLWVTEAWDDNDQVCFDQSQTQIRKAFGMSLDEVATEILAFVEESS